MNPTCIRHIKMCIDSDEIAVCHVMTPQLSFLQASANTILSHFLGLVFSLELLRSVTLPATESIPIPRMA